MALQVHVFTQRWRGCINGSGTHASDWGTAAGTKALTETVMDKGQDGGDKEVHL
jgi:hypothetical protein